MIGGGRGWVNKGVVIRGPGPNNSGLGKERTNISSSASVQSHSVQELIPRLPIDFRGTRQFDLLVHGRILGIYDTVLRTTTLYELSKKYVGTMKINGFNGTEEYHGDHNKIPQNPTSN